MLPRHIRSVAVALQGGSIHCTLDRLRAPVALAATFDRAVPRPALRYRSASTTTEKVGEGCL